MLVDLPVAGRPVDLVRLGMNSCAGGDVRARRACVRCVCEAGMLRVREECRFRPGDVPACS
eukprot:6194704-Pleurochrysis_carterae.AAC.3